MTRARRAKPQEMPAEQAEPVVETSGPGIEPVAIDDAPAAPEPGEQ